MTMRSLIVRLRNRLRRNDRQPTAVPPSLDWLLEHREERKGQSALTGGYTPTASLYRMYEYLVAGYVTGLRTEIEYFFNQPWPVASIPDPQDADPGQYAVLAGLPFYLIKAFNRLIERGLPRGSPAIITPDYERRMAEMPIVLEKEPSWVARVPKLAEVIVIPDDLDNTPAEEHRSVRFLEMNIIVEEPQVLFV